ncbi:MAG TPA: glycosyltransferase [Candidatus Acidoferrales bacterium]|nr:glycosyltransferase [Candidatus Acidoferrales bacterium]
MTKAWHGYVRVTVKPDLSIVVPVYGNWWMTRRLLHALDDLRAQSETTFETIVVDNASRDETWEGLAAFSWVRRLQLEANRNFEGGCNAGATIAQAPVVLFLNNDAWPIGDPLAPLVRAFDDEQLVIAGGILFFEDGPIQNAGNAVHADGSFASLLRNLDPSFVAQRAIEPFSPLGTAFAVRASWFASVGMFDERYVNGTEEHDLVMRAKEDGRGVRVIDAARFTHFSGATRGPSHSDRENERLFHQRWSSAIASVSRIDRGTLGAFVLHDASPDPLARRAIAALRAELALLGHPVVERIAPWMPIDTRFRRSARVALRWFARRGAASEPALTVVTGEPRAQIEVTGALRTRVPFLPFADERAACAFAFDPDAERVAFVGCTPQRVASVRAELGEAGADVIEPAELIGSQRERVAMAVCDAIGDASGYGRAVLARAGIPCIDSRSPALAGELLRDRVARVERATAARLEADRGWTLRRSAQRIIDLGFYARNGLERPMIAG